MIKHNSIALKLGFLGGGRGYIGEGLRALIRMSTESCTELLNHYMVHLQLM